MTYVEDGAQVFLAYRADYAAFNAWLDKRLTSRL